MFVQVLKFNSIAKQGLSIIEQAGIHIAEHSTQQDGIILRSQQLHDYVFPDSVKVVVRAGAGVNNIPVAELTKKGIVVLNTPGANANAVKELVLTSMLMASRNIFPACQFVSSLDETGEGLEKTVEQAKKQFVGRELPGKILGVVGLGKIGLNVANCAISLGMRVLGYDPHISVENSWKLSANVERAHTMAELFYQADFLTLHVPLIEQTRHFISNKEIADMRRGMALFNFSRADVVDNQAILEAIQNKHLSCYACDFPDAKFKNIPNILMFPHLGASTIEAELNCAVMAANQLKAFLTTGEIINSVNFPETRLSPIKAHRVTVINDNIPSMVSHITNEFANANINIDELVNKSRQDVAYTVIDISTKPSADLLKKIEQINGVLRVRSLAHE
ncbi:MAG: hypothetical protein A3F17_02625 [Gammaproteobacteria bacterium RIFCSPHIGHO2_12_FULL_41_15]|nr:MAG: hypothetical protein A3F17_02625 [Gammaproteobacteria bacterium RIFCSPHIGHO2_12_FULL_41_15]